METWILSFEIDGRRGWWSLLPGAPVLATTVTPAAVGPAVVQHAFTVRF